MCEFTPTPGDEFPKTKAKLGLKQCLLCIIRSDASSPAQRLKEPHSRPNPRANRQAHLLVLFNNAPPHHLHPIAKQPRLVVEPRFDKLREIIPLNRPFEFMHGRHERARDAWLRTLHMRNDMGGEKKLKWASGRRRRVRSLGQAPAQLNGENMPCVPPGQRQTVLVLDDRL